MSTYVMSDIHGCYDELMKMLELISFSKGDRLIMAGDYVDRGPKSYEMLKWIETNPDNVLFLRGNHDEEFVYYVELMQLIFERHDMSQESIKDTKLAYEMMLAMTSKDGRVTSLFDYYGTIGKLIYEQSINMKQLSEWCECICEMPYVYKGDVAGKTFVVVHGGYVDSLENMESDERYDTLEEFYMYARDDAYIYGGIKNGIVIAGHTPTIFNDEIPYNDGDVYRSYDEETDCVFYDIDCGCAYRENCSTAKLACIRLEDEKVFYV